MSDTNGLLLKCMVCEQIFTSMMLFDMHISTHAPANYYTVFNYVAENEIRNGRGEGLQLILDSVITLKIIELRQILIPISKKRMQTNTLKNHASTPAKKEHTDV